MDKKTIEYLEGLPSGKQKDRLINNAHKNALENMSRRAFRLVRYGTTSQGRYK
jgi:hypothetical protein